MSTRTTEYPIDDQFTKRWSPRAFTEDEISEGTLLTGFEAARWAPSSGNSQPWHFVYSRRGSDTWDQFCHFLNEGNRVWAAKAAALIIVISKKEFKLGDKILSSGNSTFDTGAAWMNFALEMNKLGWHTHGMAGIETQKISSELDLPPGFTIECMIAVGKMGDRSLLPERLQAREEASDRKPVSAFVFDGKFNKEWIKTE